jgi:putative membrane protein
MSPETYRWLLVAHIFGFMMWTGSLIGTIHVLMAHGEADEAGKRPLGGLAERLALVMDIGAGIAIAFGLAMLLSSPGRALLKSGGWMHMKLTAVAVLIGVHGFVRVAGKKIERGETRTLPAWLVPALQLLILAILVFVVVRPTAK